jgi:hypothetical protein
MAIAKKRATLASATEDAKETEIQDLGALCVFVVKPFCFKCNEF